MNIAIQSADLDADRIDGTRVYLLRLLERFGRIAPEHTWHLFHRQSFNPALAPPCLPNYFPHAIPFPFFWTQTRFSAEIFRLKPDRLFVPVQTLPFFLPKDTQSIVTIHDLAFKLFPEHFPARDRRRLNWFTDFAVRRASRLIAVSESTKRDILTYYPDTLEEKIRVIHHGFDTPDNSVPPAESASILEKFHLKSKRYLLYVGAIQPRKNLLRLLQAFEFCAPHSPDMKLVIAGEAAWMSESVFCAREEHPFRDRIIITDRISFKERASLYREARIFVFPSLYEGFGLPILEAFAAEIPVITANNSSLPEVAGDAALFVDADSVDALAESIRSLWNNETQQKSLIERGKKQLEKFSWDRSAKKTLAWILEE